MTEPRLAVIHARLDVEHMIGRRESAASASIDARKLALDRPQPTGAGMVGEPGS